MKWFFFAGIIFFIGPLFFIKNSYEKYRVAYNGHLVKMQIKDIPGSCIGSRVPYIVTLIYHTEIYTKQLRGDFCEKHQVGESIDIKLLEGVRTIMLPNEAGWIDLTSCILLSLFGLMISIKSVIKKS